MTIPLGPTGQPSIFGGIGKLEFAPTNNPDDPNPTKVDITQYVRTEDNPLRITMGRQTELDAIQPAQLTCDLDNTDSRFTFGLTSGPYGANWAPGKKVFYSETIGGRTFLLFTGWIEFPDINDWQPIGLQYVQLTCTDRLTRLSRGRKFISTLGEWIRYNNRNGALKGYWPMNGTSLSFQDVTGQQPPLTPDPTVLPSLVAPQFNNATVPVGDDLATATFGYDPVNDATGTSLLSTLAGGGIPLLAGQVVTIMAWISPNFPDMTNTAALANATPIRLDTAETPTTSQSSITFNGASFPDGVHWAGGAVGTNRHFGSNSSATLPFVVNNFALPVMVQYGFSPDVGRAMYGSIDLGPYTALGSNPTTVTLTTMRAPWRDWAGAIGHVQLYVGAPGDFTVADYMAQFSMGTLGLEWQSTGQRINTLLDYAGVSGTDRLVDPGVSFMQKAKLAGLDPQTALQNAVTTERGRGFADGLGRYVFHDRIRIYNV